MLISLLLYLLLTSSLGGLGRKAFYPNQHYPLPPTYQLQPFPNYYFDPQYKAVLPLKKKPPSQDENELERIKEIQKQIQQWEIAVHNSEGNPGVVWINAPQYGYYPPPSQYPYPPPGYPQPYPPPPPEVEYPSTEEPQTEESQPSFETTKQDSNETLLPIPTSTDPITTTLSSGTTIDGTITLSPIETPAPTVPETSPSGVPISTIEPSTTKEPNTTKEPSTITEPSTTREPSTESNSTPNSTVPSSSTASPSNNTSNETNSLLKYCKKPRGQFPSNSSCNTFINCWDDTAVEQSCPPELVFNGQKGYCDYPSNVDCGNLPTEPSTSTSTDSSSSASPINPKCPTGSGTYRNQSNCAAFYVCVYGIPVDFTCPSGTNFNDELKVCDFPYRVDCKGIPSIQQPVEEESSTDIVTETTDAVNSTTPLTTNATTPIPLTSPLPSNNDTATSTPLNNSTEIPTTSPDNTTIPPAPVTELPPFVDPIAFFNYNLKKIPESIVNTNVRCFHKNVYRLTPDCSSVTVCQNGYTYIVNCGHGTSYDAFSEKCVSVFRARC